MNQSLQSYTPVPMPIQYDSLKAQEGCEPETGNNMLGVLAFDQICVFSHDEFNAKFTQLDTVSYTIGPATPGTPGQPQATVWAGWVGTVGIRIGKLSIVEPPSDGLGEASSLFPETTPTKLSIAFNSEGLIHIAIQATPTTTEIKRYVDVSGSTDSTTFPGESAILLNVDLLNFSQNPGIVCYYLRSERPGELFARFEQESYAYERVIMPDLRAVPTRIISAEPKLGRAIMYLSDEDGRDITLYTPIYSQVLEVDQATLTVSFDSGVLFELAVSEDIPTEKCTLSVSFDSGALYDGVAESPVNPTEKATLSVAFDSGELTPVST